VSAQLGYYNRICGIGNATEHIDQMRMIANTFHELNFIEKRFSERQEWQKD
jgi:hypothetical protein